MIPGKVNVKECAVMANDIYYSQTKLQHKNFTYWSIKKPDKVSMPNYNSAFFARLYIKEISFKPTAAIISFRGTQALKHWDNDKDDIDIALKKLPDSSRSAQHFAHLSILYVIKTYGFKPRLTGHSLGGALAQLVAIQSSYHPETIVFNSPGIENLPGVTKKHYNYIHNFDSKDDLVHEVGTEAGTEQTIAVSKGDSLLHAGERLLSIPLMLYGAYEQHSMKNLMRAIDKHPLIANEQF